MKRLVMELNRSAVLEAPEKNIPWFHDRYCMENVLPLLGRHGKK